MAGDKELLPALAAKMILSPQVSTICVSNLRQVLAFHHGSFPQFTFPSSAFSETAFTLRPLGNNTEYRTCPASLWLSGEACV